MIIYNFLRNILENGFKKQKQIINEKINTANLSGKKILDLGCGTGSYSEFFLTENYYGLEIEPSYIKFAKQCNGKNYVLGDGRYLPFHDCLFGAVCAISVFHHLSRSDINDVLKELKRVILPDGFILIMDQSRFDVHPLVDWIFNFIRYFDKGNFIREPKENLDIISADPEIRIIENFIFRSGLITNQAIIIKKK
jgi:ubiquinone/menaquinone biosynthesis C-methylase UbiE